MYQPRPLTKITSIRKSIRWTYPGNPSMTNVDGVGYPGTLENAMNSIPYQGDTGKSSAPYYSIKNLFVTGACYEWCVEEHL